MKRWFYAVVALQVAFLLAQAVSSQVMLNRGRVVTLKTAPVDPRSLFMGNYMDLRYEISAIHLRSIAHDGHAADYRSGRTVYVELRPGKPWAVPVSLRFGRPAVSGANVYLRGQVLYESEGIVNVEYGLERYYIPEARQDEVADLGWSAGSSPVVTVDVSVVRSGGAVIRRVLVNGKPLPF